MNKLRAYELQNGGMDTVRKANETLGFAADALGTQFSAPILKNSAPKENSAAFEQPGKSSPAGRSQESAWCQRVPCQPRISRISRAYLQTKKSRMGHLLDGLK